MLLQRNSSLGYITRLTRTCIAEEPKPMGIIKGKTEKTPCHANYQPLNPSKLLALVGDFYVYAFYLSRLKMETKLFLLATLGLTGDALCGIGGGLGMGELDETGRGDPDTFLSMPFRLLLRLSSPFGVPIGVGGSSLLGGSSLGGGGFTLSSSTGDVALAMNAGPGWEVSDTADCDRFWLGCREWLVVGR